METIEDIRRRLFGLTNRGMKFGLERIAQASGRFGNPHAACRSFHIAGTNGKGSTCAFIESALRCMGIKTGMFVSPHLVRFEERFQICGVPVTEEQWLPVYQDLRDTIESDALTFFEATTLMAFELFRREKVAWSVIETGLGGRLDATNIIRPAVTVITRLALDHAEYLGNTPALVAAEKLGTVKPGVPLIMARPDDSEIMRLARERCDSLGSGLAFVSEEQARDISLTHDGAVFVWRGGTYAVNLAGRFQVLNALLALEALSAAGFDDYRGIASGLARAWLPGRFQMEKISGKTVVFDVGHNPDAVAAFVGGMRMRFAGKKICVVTGIMRDKDYAAILVEYCRIASTLHVCAPATPRAAPSLLLLENIPETFTGERAGWPDVVSAVKTAMAGPDEVVCIAGSFFTVGDAMTFLGIDPAGKMAEK